MSQKREGSGERPGAETRFGGPRGLDPVEAARRSHEVRREKLDIIAAITDVLMGKPARPGSDAIGLEHIAHAVYLKLKEGSSEHLKIMLDRTVGPVTRDVKVDATFRKTRLVDGGSEKVVASLPAIEDEEEDAGETTD